MADEPHDTPGNAAGDDPGQWLLHGDLACLGCQYNLRGLVGPIVACPECGHHNDLRRSDLWSRKEVPLGVRIRDHWPATAVGWSLTAPIMLGCAALTFTSGAIGAVFGLVIAGGWLAMWVHFCLKWIRNSKRTEWAICILVALHACAWLFLVTPWLAVTWSDQYGHMGSLMLLAMPVTGAAIVFMQRAIRRADREGQFRDDWMNWRVPESALSNEQKPQ